MIPKIFFIVFVVFRIKGNLNYLETEKRTADWVKREF